MIPLGVIDKALCESEQYLGRDVSQKVEDFFDRKLRKAKVHFCSC